MPPDIMKNDWQFKNSKVRRIYFLVQIMRRDLRTMNTYRTHDCEA